VLGGTFRRDDRTSLIKRPLVNLATGGRSTGDGSLEVLSSRVLIA